MAVIKNSFIFEVLIIKTMDTNKTLFLFNFIFGITGLIFWTLRVFYPAIPIECPLTLTCFQVAALLLQIIYLQLKK